jgi:hypothetical protein
MYTALAFHHNCWEAAAATILQYQIVVQLARSSVFYRSFWTIEAGVLTLKGQAFAIRARRALRSLMQWGDDVVAQL